MQRHQVVQTSHVVGIELHLIQPYLSLVTDSQCGARSREVLGPFNAHRAAYHRSDTIDWFHVYRNRSAIECRFRRRTVIHIDVAERPMPVHERSRRSTEECQRVSWPCVQWYFQIHSEGWPDPPKILLQILGCRVEKIEMLGCVDWLMPTRFHGLADESGFNTCKRPHCKVRSDRERSPDFEIDRLEIEVPLNTCTAIVRAERFAIRIVNKKVT